jgi:1-acyl-sn-glycerol-3-phosphate acyltransferase
VRWPLAPLRAVLLVLHILLGLAIVTLVFPRVVQATRNRINRWWSGVVVRVCGARVRVAGQPLDAALAATGIEPDGRGRLLLSNHVSWIDIFAINAVLPCRFVAKAEIGRWPVIGSLVTRSGTLYIERGRRRAVASMNDTVQSHLRAGESIVVFPEGTTSRGDRLLPFHSNLVAPAVEVDSPVWPVGLRYRERGVPSEAAAFVDEMSLLDSLFRVLTADRLEIEIAFLAPLDAAAHANRHTIARAAHAALSEHFGFVEVPERAEADDSNGNGSANGAGT